MARSPGSASPGAASAAGPCPEEGAGGQNSGASAAAERWPGPHHRQSRRPAALAELRAEDTEGSDDLSFQALHSHQASLTRPTQDGFLLPHQGSPRSPSLPPIPPAPITPSDLEVKLLDHVPHVLQNQLPKLLQPRNVGPASSHTPPPTGVSVGKASCTQVRAGLAPSPQLCSGAFPSSPATGNSFLSAQVALQF